MIDGEIGTPENVPSIQDASVKASNNDVNSSVEQRPLNKAQDSSTFTQDDVNRIIKGVKMDAYEKARRDLEVNQKQVNNSSTVSDDQRIRQLVDSQFESKRAEYERKAQESAQLEAAQKIANDFTKKMLEFDKQRYPDFEQKVSKLQFQNLAEESPHIIAIAASLDNTSDVMYELANSPMKLGGIAALSKVNPALAAEEMIKLSESIKRDNQNLSRPTPKEPLTQIKPSTAGRDNGSPQSVSDFRKLLKRR